MGILNDKVPFFVHCAACAHEWAVAFLPLPIDAFIKLGKSPCPMCASNKVYCGPFPKHTDQGDAMAWLANCDTGLSSLTIWNILMGNGTRRTSETPHDPDDFGRCYRLLKVMPSWRARLSEVSDRCPEWKPLVDAWDELTALYEAEWPTGTCPRLYRRMQELRTNEGLV